MKFEIMRVPAEIGDRRWERIKGKEKRSTLIEQPECGYWETVRDVAPRLISTWRSYPRSNDICPRRKVTQKQTRVSNEYSLICKNLHKNRTEWFGEFANSLFRIKIVNTSSSSFHSHFKDKENYKEKYLDAFSVLFLLFFHLFFGTDTV